MALKHYFEAERVCETEYNVYFENELGGGFRFPCDEKGNVNFDSMQECAVSNYNYAMAHEEEFPMAFNQVIKTFNRYTKPAYGICCCGRIVCLAGGYYGADECDCGRWYNTCGQEVLPPSMWEEDFE